MCGTTVASGSEGFSRKPAGEDEGSLELSAVPIMGGDATGAEVPGVAGGACKASAEGVVGTICPDGVNSPSSFASLLPLEASAERSGADVAILSRSVVVVPTWRLKMKLSNYCMG